MSGMGGLALIRVELNSILLVTLLALLQEKQLVSNSCSKKCLKNIIYKILVPIIKFENDDKNSQSNDKEISLEEYSNFLINKKTEHNSSVFYLK